MITISNRKRDEAVAVLSHFVGGTCHDYVRDANAVRKARILIAYLERLQPSPSLNCNNTNDNFEAKPDGAH